MPLAPTVSLETIETYLTDLIPRVLPAPNPRGRPEILPGTLLWTALLVGIARGGITQLELWRQLSQTGLWEHPRIPVSAEAVRQRLVRHGPAVVQTLFTRVTAELLATVPADETLAPFATGVYALDESTLDQVARTLPHLRPVPPGDDRLLPGKVAAAFDLRRQLFTTIQTIDAPRQNERVAARAVLATVPPGSLILADLGYFGFEWFDDLTDGGYHFVSKLRKHTSVEPVHTLTRTAHVTDELVWLGAHRSDQAKHLVRRIAVRLGGVQQVYLTNVREPDRLPVAEVVRLYARRWDIELAFKTLKCELGLGLLWSAKRELIALQLWGALLIAQIASALRAEVAQRAGIDLFDVSLALLLRELPAVARREGSNTLAYLATLPRVKGGYLRPARRTPRTVPGELPVSTPPPTLVTLRTPRYAGRKCGPNRTDRRPR